MRKIKYLVVHCSATQEGRHIPTEEIKRWHLKKGWSDIGYHAVIELDGSVHDGRPEIRIGAGVKGYNKNSLHICYIGGYEAKKKNGKWVSKDTRTQAQKDALRDMLEYWKNLHPNAEVLGHRDFPNVAKSCPCFSAKDEYKDITDRFKHLDFNEDL